MDNALKVIKKLPQNDERIYLEIYLQARIAEKNQQTLDAITYFVALPNDYRDSIVRLKNICTPIYNKARQTENISYLEALKIYKTLPPNFEDTNRRITKLSSFEDILGEYRCVNSETDASLTGRSSNNVTKTYMIDMYSSDRGTVIKIPSVYGDNVQEKLAYISGSNGSYNISIEDGYLDYNVKFYKGVLTLTANFTTTTGGEGIINLLWDTFIASGLDALTSLTTTEIWEKTL